MVRSRAGCLPAVPLAGLVCAQLGVRSLKPLDQCLKHVTAKLQTSAEKGLPSHMGTGVSKKDRSGQRSEAAAKLSQSFSSGLRSLLTTGSSDRAAWAES